MKEVKEALDSTPNDSCPWLDGFSTAFIKVVWNIFQNDVWKAAMEFFNGYPLPTFYGATNLVLIPKMDKPDSFTKFEPISLCCVVYKIFFKIIVNRMSPILS